MSIQFDGQTIWDRQMDEQMDEQTFELRDRQIQDSQADRQTNGQR